MKNPSLISTMIPTIRSHVAAILFPLAVLAAISTGLAPGVCAPASVSDEPAELSEARARYEKDVELAIRPLRDRYVQALERIMKSLTLRGDLAGALMVQKEMEPFASGVGIARFAGDWVCTFSSGSVHHYKIDADGTFYWTDRTPRKSSKPQCGATIMSWILATTISCNASDSPAVN